MRRMSTGRRAFFVAAALLVLGTMVRRAEAQAQPHYHDKFYLRLAGGLSYFSDAVESEPITSPLRLGRVTGTIKGVAPAAELAAGYAVLPGLIVGGGLYFHWILSPSTDNGNLEAVGDVPETVNFAGTTLALLGPFVDYYFDPAAGFHVQGSIAYGILSLGEGRGANTDRAYVQEQSGGGLALMAGVGYELWVSGGWSVGALGRLTAGWGSGDDKNGYAWKHTILVPALLFSATMN
jgi:hypothetical protein